MLSFGLRCTDIVTANVFRLVNNIVNGKHGQRRNELDWEWSSSLSLSLSLPLFLDFRRTVHFNVFKVKNCSNLVYMSSVFIVLIQNSFKSIQMP